jgi:putative transposase
MVKGLFSKRISHSESITAARKKKRERGIWQRRFWEHLIHDEQDYEHHVNYIHFNPVKQGYVNRPSSWRYSSIHSDIQKRIVTDDWACSNPFELSNFRE